MAIPVAESKFRESLANADPSIPLSDVFDSSFLALPIAVVILENPVL